MKAIKRIIIVLFSLIIVFVAGFYIYATSGTYQPGEIALKALESSENVIVDNSKDSIKMTPIDAKNIGIIFYPGGKVKPESYSPILRELAENGYPVVIVKMPLNLAVLNWNKAEKFINNDTKWIIAGHSLGGAMAAKYVYDNPEIFEGLALWGSYPAESNDLSNYDKPIISIFGSKDMGIEGIYLYKNLLPKSTSWQEIQGGNHAQFGDYGFQKGDNVADITREEQQSKVVSIMLEFMNEFNQ